MLRLCQRLVRAGAAGVGFGFIIISGFAWWAAATAHAGNGSFKDDDVIIIEPPLAAWHGCYIGLSAGGNIDSSSATFGAPVTSVSGPDDTGLALGGYTGCNLQIGTLVLGVEGDLSTASNDPHWFGSARLRLGTTIGSQTLIYATGGYAFARQSYDIFAGAAGVRVSRTATGFAYGGGISYAFGGGNAVRLEAIHYDYDTHDDLNFGLARVTQAHTVIRVGVTFGFSGGLFGGFGGGTDPDVIQ